MRPRLTILLAGLAVAGGLLAGAGGMAQADKDDMPYTGTWKVNVLSQLSELTLCIIKIEREGRFLGEIVASNPAPQFAGLKVKEVLADTRAVRFQLTAAKSGLTFDVAAYARKGKADRLLGSAMLRGRPFPVVLVRTEENKLAKADVSRRIEGADDFEEADKLDGEPERKAMSAILAKNEGKLVGLMAARALFLNAARAKDVELLGPGSKVMLQESVRYGTEMELDALSNIAGAYLRADKGAETSVAYARKAVALLSRDTSTEVRARTLRLLATGLKATRADAELKKVRAQLAVLDEQLDREFEKTAIPFKVKKFAGREGRSKRVALVELFTGAQCPPCVAADTAFDAGIKAYGTKDAIFLQYHLHIPGPDPMTNKDTEARQRYYGDEEIEGTPTCIIDGKNAGPMGGSKAEAQSTYERLTRTINRAMEEDAEAKVGLKVERKGDKIDITATVEAKGAGKKARLRLVLIEKSVRYVGSNGLRIHHHVVRAMPGGANGFALEDGNKHSASVDVEELRKGLRDYLRNFEKEERPFPNLDGEYPVALSKLEVVAFVQDDGSKRVLQAVQADVPPGR